MSHPTTIPPAVNNTVKVVLRSPVHGMVSSTLMLITFTGRKTGKKYTTPVSYSQYGNQVRIFTHAGWWKNLCGGKPVTLRLRGHDLEGIADAVADDKQAVAAGLAEHLCRVHSDARYYDVTFDAQGNPKANEIEEAARSVVMVRVQLC